MMTSRRLRLWWRVLIRLVRSVAFKMDEIERQRFTISHLLSSDVTARKCSASRGPCSRSLLNEWRARLYTSAVRVRIGVEREGTGLEEWHQTREQQHKHQQLARHPERTARYLPAVTSAQHDVSRSTATRIDAGDGGESGSISFDCGKVRGGGSGGFWRSEVTSHSRLLFVRLIYLSDESCHVTLAP